MGVSLQRLVSGVLDANMKEWSMKEVIVMVGMIRTLAGQLETDSAEVCVHVYVPVCMYVCA